MKPKRISDKDRAQWIANDEGFYLWWKGTHLTVPKFIKTNRKLIDNLIHKRLTQAPISSLTAEPEGVREAHEQE